MTSQKDIISTEFPRWKKIEKQCEDLKNSVKSILPPGKGEKQ